MPHYVYLYRDSQQRPQYVGYGKLVTRANAHRIRSHNPMLAKFISQRKFTVEITGPFESEATGRAVEAALISALQPQFNRIEGPSNYRLRPLGVPEQFAARPVMRPLQQKDFFARQKKPPMPVLFVKESGQPFDDGRKAYDLANPPSDADILKRMRGWWQLSRYIPKWIASLKKSPGLLIAVSGSPGAQFAIASVLIDRARWEKAEQWRGLISVPLLDTPNLDAFELRGRRIDKSLRLRFGPWRHQLFTIITPSGHRRGGGRTA